MEICNTIAVLLIIFLCFILLFLLRMILCDYYFDKAIVAIHQYKEQSIRNREYDNLNLIDYGDMRNFGNTLLRIWDWGYTSVLPRDKLEIIKPYIK